MPLAIAILVSSHVSQKGQTVSLTAQQTLVCCTAAASTKSHGVCSLSVLFQPKHMNGIFSVSSNARNYRFWKWRWYSEILTWPVALLLKSLPFCAWIKIGEASLKALRVSLEHFLNHLEHIIYQTGFCCYNIALQYCFQKQVMTSMFRPPQGERCNQRDDLWNYCFNRRCCTGEISSPPNQSKWKYMKRKVGLLIAHADQSGAIRSTILTRKRK